jgi:hypothetical protein
LRPRFSIGTPPPHSFHFLRVVWYPTETVAYTDSGRKMTYSPFLLAAPLVEPKSSLENFDEKFHFLLTAYYRKPSLVKATHWGAVAALLHEYRPDLRGILDMHLLAL